MFACQKGFEELVQYLLRRNASLDIQNDKGQTALMLASGWGHASCVRFFIFYFFNVKLSPFIG